MEQTSLTRSDCDLIVGLCQYAAQILYAHSTKRDPNQWSETREPLIDNVVPAGTRLHDGDVKIYRRAAEGLVICGFAKEIARNGGEYTLIIASDQFALDHPVTPQGPSRSDLGSMLRLIFDVYSDFEILGPPASLRHIFDLLFAAGFTELRHGHLEWSEKASAINYSRPLSTVTDPMSELLWKTDLFDWHVEEAAKQWP